jgi:hypothetical protein
MELPSCNRINSPTILLAIELSASTWLVAARVPGSEKPHLHRIEGGDTVALLTLISSLRARVARRHGAIINVVCCFEAGRDGFWLQRFLTAQGVDTHVLEPTSILINRQMRKMPNARTASARAWRRKGFELKTALKRCYSPRAFGKGLHCVHGTVILPFCAPVTDVGYQSIFGPNWTACVDGLS